MWLHVLQEFSEADEHEFKAHIIPKALVEDVTLNLVARGLPSYTQKVIESCGLDRRGMCMTTRSIQDLEVDGLTVHVPSEHVEHFLHKLENLGVRTEIGQPYYKLHSWLMCVCLTPEQRDILLSELRRVLPEANALAQLEHQQWMEARAEAVKHNVLMPAKVVNIKDEA